MKNFIAKTESGETVIEHSKNVYYTAEKLMEINNSPKDIKPYILFASLFHDIGKVTSDFQKHIMDKNYEQKLPHNLISFKFITECFDFDGNYDVNKMLAAMKSILYHHPFLGEWKNAENLYTKVIFCDDIYTDSINLNETDIKNITDVVIDLICFFNERNDLKIKLTSPHTTYYFQNTYNEDNDRYIKMFVKNPNDILNEYFLVFSQHLRGADVYASSCIPLTDSIFNISHKSSLIDFKCKPGYDIDIFKQQIRYVDEMISNGNISEINEPVGFGKTNVLLMASLCLNKKIIFVSPTNITTHNAYLTTQKFLMDNNLSDKISVGMFISGKWVYGAELEDLNDIIVTNIDNCLGPIVKSDKYKRNIFDLAYRTIIFDEYHQYFTQTPILQDFNVLLKTRSVKYGVSKTFLSSATQQKFIYSGLANEINVFKKTRIGCNKRKFKIKFIDGFVATPSITDTCFVTNSISRCQEICRNNSTDENKFLLYHSEYTQKDRMEIEKILLNTHGNDAKFKPLNVSATNIISTGLNLSFKTIVMGRMPLYDIYQTIGRCNRFCEYDYGTIIFDETITNANTERYSIRNKWDEDLCTLEFSMLKERLKPEMTLDEIDMVFEDIIKNDVYEQKIREKYNEYKNTSAKLLSEMIYRYGNRINDENGILHISNNISLRTSKDNETVGLFVWCKGMGENEFVNKTHISLNKIEDKYVMNMYNFLLRHQNIAEKYYGKHEWNCIKNWNPRKLKERFIKDARSSDKPFILTDYQYTKDYGLEKSM